MSFTSFSYIFLLFITEYLSRKLHKRNHFNAVLICASFIFYAAWDFRFFTLILGSSILDFFISKKLYADKNRHLIYMSVIVNLGVLFLFKYYNFFIDEFTSFFSLEKSYTISLILPAGISFYTFQTMGYTIDVYRKKIKPEKDFITFLSFVSFFPQLIAGPIERAEDLLPQLQRSVKKRESDILLGINEFLWGAFKKVVLADNIAPFVNDIFSNYGQYDSNILVLGLVLFSLQIYFDFSGYSHMAIGSAKILGIQLTINFDKPYFARSIGEFWSKWHITLSRWFKDYLYIPLGGNRKGQARRIINTLIVFLISGLWHGANWTFLMWGVIHFLAYFVEVKLWPSKRRSLLSLIVTQSFVLLAWLFFRSNSIVDAFYFISGIFSFTFSWYLPRGTLLVLPLVLSVLLILYEKYDRQNKYFLPNFHGEFRTFDTWWLSIVAIVIMSLSGSTSEFIYFQF